MSEAVAFEGKLPCNNWTMAETDKLKEIVRRCYGQRAITEELRRFTWAEIRAKIDRLVEQGFLIIPAASTL